MKRFIAALLCAAAAYAETDEEKAEREAKEKAESVGDWFSSGQEPVAWESITSGSKCKLKGVYGGYKKVGFSQAFIRETVHDCNIPNGARVVTWAKFPNPDKVGEAEGLYCSVKYTGQDGNKSASVGEIDVETQTGKIDYAGFAAANKMRKDWCKAEADGTEGACAR